MSKMFRGLPSVHELLEMPQLRRLLDGAGRTAVVRGVRQFLDGLRTEAKETASDWATPLTDLAERIAAWMHPSAQPIRPVVNATGVLLHPDLGRAPLAREAADAAHDVSIHYGSVEWDVESGGRRERRAALDSLRTLSGAEGALVAPSYAAAQWWCLTGLASGSEVIAARSDLGESAGRRPQALIAASGAILREVGAANTTRLDDYQQGVTPKSAMLLRAIPSGYQILGVHEETPLAELADLARRHHLTLVCDLGIGPLTSLSAYGVTFPNAAEQLQAGAQLVVLRGNGLLGGPECGILVGKRELIERLASHPLAPAMEADRSTLAALDATLGLYQRGADQMERSLPLVRLLSTSLDNLRNRAERLAPQLAASPLVAAAVAEDGEAHLDEGNSPALRLASAGVTLTPATKCDELLRALRRGPVPVVAQTRAEKVRIDLRAVDPSQDAWIADALCPPSGE